MNINRHSIAYIEGRNSTYNASTGGTPYDHGSQARADWLAGRREAFAEYSNT